MGGSFTGGSVRQNGNILGRAGEIKRLEGEVKELTARIDRADDALKKLAKTIESLEDDRDSAEQKISLIKVMRDSENARLEQLSAKLDANEALIAKLRSDYEELLMAGVRYEEDRKALVVREGELTVQIAEISAARADMHGVKDAFVHSSYIETVVGSKLLHSVDKLGEFHSKSLGVNYHYHCEILAHNALGDVNDICACICATCAYLCDYSLAVVSDYRYNCFHFFTFLKVCNYFTDIISNFADKINRFAKVFRSLAHHSTVGGVKNHFSICKKIFL